MPIYDRPARILMKEFAVATLKPGQVFDKSAAVEWFGRHYAKLRPTTIALHVEGMAVNSLNRKNNPNIRPNLGWDLFFKLPNGKFRLWEEKTDPAPIYRDDILAMGAVARGTVLNHEPADEDGGADRAGEFAYEEHLQSYLTKNLNLLEPGLRLYEDEGLSGVEFPVGRRYIDVLALDSNDDFVVIELKVSRGYDRTIGQILRYIAWVKQNLAGAKNVRGIIVAGEIDEDLRLAASQVSNIKLAEYEISFKLKPVEP